MKQVLTPGYLETDYNSFRERVVSLMKQSQTFKDYNFEGSNISFLIELFAYLSELNTYYINKVAKNVFMDSLDLYETANSMAKSRGYYPKGYLAPVLNLNISLLIGDGEIGVPSAGNQLYIPAFYSFDTEIQASDGSNIKYITTKSYTIDIPSDAEYSYNFSIPLKQGEVLQYSYDANSIINNKLMLPFESFDTGNKPFKELPSIYLYVNGILWERVDNFVSEETQVNINPNLYSLEYNKYEKYEIVFSSGHNIPSENDTIKIFILKTKGTSGDISSNIIEKWENTLTIPIFSNQNFDTIDSYFIYNNTKAEGVLNKSISITNDNPSFNSGDPETIESIINNTKGVFTTQYRNVSAKDYKHHLEENPDIVKAIAWGENEVNPGYVSEFNKVNISLIPSKWDEYSILREEIEWVFATDRTVTLNNPTEYNNDFKNSILEYLSTNRYINSYENFVIPEIVYFGVILGVRISRLYNFELVKEDIKNKLLLFFDTSNRNFNEIIDFKDILNFIMDKTIVTDSDRFPNINGITNIIFRDIYTYTPSNIGEESVIYDYDDSPVKYPKFTMNVENTYENILKPIQLGRNQFPKLEIDTCSFIQEV